MGRRKEILIISIIIFITVILALMPQIISCSKSNNIEVNTQSSIKIIFDEIIYFDPYSIENNLHDADIIFITHGHYDHMDIESIGKVKNENTVMAGKNENTVMAGKAG